jgi:hypothetical protein
METRPYILQSSNSPPGKFIYLFMLKELPHCSRIQESVVRRPNLLLNRLYTGLFRTAVLRGDDKKFPVMILWEYSANWGRDCPGVSVPKGPHGSEQKWKHKDVFDRLSDVPGVPRCVQAASSGVRGDKRPWNYLQQKLILTATVLW